MLRLIALALTLLPFDSLAICSSPARIRSSSASNSLWSLLQDVDSALVRLLNIGIYLAFKSLLQEALHEVLEKRLPYLMFSADEFSKNFGDPKFEMVSLVPSENLTRFVFRLVQLVLVTFVQLIN